MDITWHGHSCFTIKSKDATIVTDPYKGLGTDLPKLKANIVTLGDELAEREGSVAEIDGDPKILDWPGEFEVLNVAIEAFSAERYAKNGDSKGSNVNIFVFAVEGVKICHLSGLAHELSDELLDHIGDVDILFLPVGGDCVLDGKAAQKLMEEIEPRIVIPMYYLSGESKFKLKGPEEFLKTVGKSSLNPAAKYSINGRAGLPEGTMEFVLLEAQN